MASFHWAEHLLGVSHDYVPVVTAATVTGVLVVGSVAGRLALGAGDKAVQPAGKFSVKGIFETLTEFVVGLSDMVVGHGGRKFVPIFGAIFTYIFLNNVMGLIPATTPATENINSTIAVGIFSFLLYNYIGFKENGIKYLAHFMGPIWALAPFLFVIEVVSHFIRPFSLGLRLASNLRSDHVLMGIFLDLAPWGVPVVFYVFGLFVCLVQAFVFLLLSMVYVSLATHHD